MAAAAATKGLFLIFTLLSLICVANSLLDKNKLDQLKEKLEKMQKRSDRVKENLTEMPKPSALLDYSIDMLDQLITNMKKINTFNDDFLPLGTFLEKVKDFAKDTKAFLDREDEELGGKMEEHENDLKELKNLVKFLEENQAEL